MVFIRGRAPELARGKLVQFLQELGDYFGLQLLEDTTFAYLPIMDRNDIELDYSEGIRHLNFLLRLKLTFWNDLPHTLPPRKCSVASARTLDFEASAKQILI